MPGIDCLARSFFKGVSVSTLKPCTSDFYSTTPNDLGDHVSKENPPSEFQAWMGQTRNPYVLLGFGFHSGFPESRK